MKTGNTLVWAGNIEDEQGNIWSLFKSSTGELIRVTFDDTGSVKRKETFNFSMEEKPIFQISSPSLSTFSKGK
jgi:hypothetical protein